MATTKPNRYQRGWDRKTKEIYYQHRAVAAWHLGRSLVEGEVVHHENGDPADNHPDNLRVFPSQRHHALYEHYRKREQRGVQHLFGIEELLEIF